MFQNTIKKSSYVLFDVIMEGMTEIQSDQLLRWWQQKGQELYLWQLPGPSPVRIKGLALPFTV